MESEFNSDDYQLRYICVYTYIYIYIYIYILICFKSVLWGWVGV